MNYKLFSVLPVLGLILGNLSPVTAFSADLQVSATILLGKGTCSIDSVTPAIFSPALNPLTALTTPDPTADATIKVTCTGLGNKTGTVAVQRQDSSPLYLLHENMIDSIAYSLTLPPSQPVTNKNPVDITLTATITGSAYQNAPAGFYTGKVGIEVLP